MADKFNYQKAAKLDLEFYLRKNVVQIAKDLIGKILVTNFNNEITAARIVETEAYNGVVDKASHAYNGRRTDRTEIMYAKGGVAYVYLCYGVHHLFNVVTNDADIPHAVLIRAGEPIEGIDIMMKRTKKKQTDTSITRGPGNLSKALGILTDNTGLHLNGDIIFLMEDNFKAARSTIKSSPRIGVDYAGEDALLKYRFFLEKNPYVSK